MENVREGGLGDAKCLEFLAQKPDSASIGHFCQWLFVISVLLKEFSLTEGEQLATRNVSIEPYHNIHNLKDE